MAASLQAVVVAVFLWRAQERTANRYLALTLLALSGILVVYPLGWHGHNEVPVWLAFLPCNLPLALGPLIYAYARGTAQETSSARAWRHAVPPAVHLSYLATLSLLPMNVAYAWKENVHDDVVKPLIELAVLISLAGYGAASFRVLRRFRVRLRTTRSDADLHDARWLFRLLASLIAIFVLLAVVRVYTNFVAEIDASPYLMWLAAWSAWLGIEGWRVAATPSPRLTEPLAPGEPERPRRDWAKLGADWQARTRLAGWWREPDLTLAELARRLGTNTLYLSRAINEGLGMNFNEMVNRLRAAEVARLIEADAATAVLPAAFEAGFNSKATFNRVFLATYGISPSKYAGRLKSKESAVLHQCEARSGRCHGPFR